MNRRQFLRGAGAALFAVPTVRLPRDVFDAAAAALASEVQRFVSRPDLTPPVLGVTRPGSAAAPGLVFLAPSSGPGQHGAMIVDGAGDLVWFHPVARKAVTDFKVQRYRGRPVLTWWEGTITKGIGDGEWVVLDPSYRQVVRFGAARGRNGDLHEFLITPQDTALVACTEVRPWRHGTVVGGVVQELALPSGRLLHEWRSLDHVPVSETAIRAKPGPRFDYFHLNSIDLAPDGHLIVSGRNTWAAYKIDRGSGRVLWRLGGTRSDFALGPGTRFYWQHDVREHADGLVTVFDNGAAPPKEPNSRALRLRLDTRRKRVSLVQADVHRPERILSHFMGDAQLLPDGHLFVGWGGSPFVTEFGASGSIVFDARLPRGGESYRAFRFPWAGRPADHPAAVAFGGSIYASWNGATEVASWQLLEGGAGGDLRPTQRVPRTGFETALRPGAGTRVAAAAALDAAGTELGRSPVVSL